MSWQELVGKYRLDERVTGILHCGAHLAEEADDYHSVGIDNVWWIEANPELIPVIEAKVLPYGHHVVHALLAMFDGEEPMRFHITNYDGMSSSVLDFGTHPEFSPDTVFERDILLPTRRIGSLVDEHGIKVNMLVMDLQGFEGPVLTGALSLIPFLDFVMTEVNCKEVYKNCTQIGDIDAILSDFDRVETYWVGDQGWGDALYVRRGR